MITYGYLSATVPPGVTLSDFETHCGLAAEIQRSANWILGDLALAVERQYPNTFHQAWPEWVSPDHLARCKAVSAAYKPEDRNIHATWTVHYQMSKRPDRVAAVAATVEAGQTSDEARRDPPPPQEEPQPARATTETEAVMAVTPVEEAPAEEPVEKPAEKPAWLLAVDVNYFIHTYYHSGAGVESASTFLQWLVRLINRLQETKGLTDAVCCMDSRTNHRKALTADWEDKYKPRSEKEADLIAQLNLAERMLKEWNLPVVSLPDMEADDVMASYAVQFDGKVTLLSGDKDMRQCLHARCNILQSVTWEENSETNILMPVYKWISAKSHTEEGSTYASTKIVGITPSQWPHFQALVGDSTDGIKGCQGIGAKGAMQLILAHGTVQGVIAACKDNQADLSETKRLAVLDFEEIAETMLKLTTLRTDLDVPKTTKLCMREPAK